MARAGSVEAAGRERKRNSHGQERRARPSSACRRGHPAATTEQGRETRSQSVCNVWDRPSLALLFQGEKRHQLQIDLPLPSWDQFNVYSRAAPSRIYQQFRQKDVSCVPQHTRTQGQAFLIIFPNQSSARPLDRNLLTALSAAHVCSESKKLFPKKSMLGFNFNYLPVQIIGN